MHASQRFLSAFFVLAIAAMTMGTGPLWAENSSMPPNRIQIKGIGPFKFGAHLNDFSGRTCLQPVDPRATGTLLRVSPYGDNYLVTDVKGLTWGNIPVTGLVVTFHDDILIDIQIALKASKGDFYVADRAFQEKYGPNDSRTYPVITWSGSKIQVTLIFSGLSGLQADSVDASSQGKVELFDQEWWSKFEAARMTKLNAVLNQRYEASIKKVKANL